MDITDVQICNDALTLCGSPVIASLSDTSREGKLCNNNYARSRDYVLREHPWNCAIKRVQLAKITGGTPSFDFDNSYLLPSDCLKVVRIGSEPEWRQDEYRVEGRTILSSDEPLKLIYVHQVTDESLFDHHIAESIAHYLAYRISYALTGSTTLRTSLLREYQIVLRKAKSMDAKEDPSAKLHADLFVESRRNIGAERTRMDILY